jgi:ribosomal protein S18 acetylase RimI-like enzyme
MVGSLAARLPGVEIRFADEADIKELLSFWDVAAGPTRLRSDREALRRLIERDPEALTIAVESGVIVGSLITGWDGWRCHLYRLAVAPEARRRGLGALLVARAREHARLLGARRLDARVDEDNHLGRAFWSGIGFVPGDVSDRRWSAPL